MSQAAVRQQIVNYLLSKSEGSQASVLGTAPTLPVTITYGVDDQFVYTPVSTGTPETFTVAPGDGFTFYPGCDKSMGDGGCGAGGFNNLVNFLAPGVYAPQPELQIG